MSFCGVNIPQNFHGIAVLRCRDSSGEGLIIGIADLGNCVGLAQGFHGAVLVLDVAIGNVGGNVAGEGATGDRCILIIGNRNVTIKGAVRDLQVHLRCRIVVLRIALVQSLNAIKCTTINRNADVLLGGVLCNCKRSTFRGSAIAVRIALIFSCRCGKGTAFNGHFAGAHFNSSAALDIGVLNNNIGYACLIDAVTLRLDSRTVNGHFITKSYNIAVHSKAVAALQGSLYHQFGCGTITPQSNGKV